VRTIRSCECCFLDEESVAFVTIGIDEALACWLAGLTADASNAYDPIDYDACTIDVSGLGKCESQ
jgi:hypothetical protein